MANTYRQIASAGSNGVATSVLQQVFNVLAASQISVFVVTQSTTATVFVTDSLGNTYSQAGSYQSLTGVGRGSWWYASNTPVGSCTVTATLSAATGCDMTMLEYAGTKTSAAIDGTSGGTGTSAAPATGSISVAGTADLVLAAMVTVTTGAIGYIPSPSMTNRRNAAATEGFKVQVCDTLAASSVTAVVFHTDTSSGWLALGASFLTQPAPPAPPVPVNIYARREPGPPMRGFPWTRPMPLPIGTTQANPPKPPSPPSPPVPVPPSPPGPPVPPVPPVPPAPDQSSLPGALAPDETASVMTRRFTQQVADMLNPLVTTGQLVLVNGVWQLVVTADGLSGPIGDP